MIEQEWRNGPGKTVTGRETIDKAVDWALAAARDAGHGYDQENRWGPDYDCSSFVIAAWQQAGVPVRSAGAGYTGDMLPAFLRCGFCDVTGQIELAGGRGLQKGDVLLNLREHTELYVGNGECVKASINERGSVTGGERGDQNGREICVGRYCNYPWDHVLRYMGGDGGFAAGGIVLPLLRPGARGESVRAMQGVLIARGFGCGPDGADGDFGANTEAALRRFQTENGLEADGVCGGQSWKRLLGVSG